MSELPQSAGASTLNADYNQPVDMEKLGLEIGDPENGMIPVTIAATGQTIRLREDTPPENVKAIIEGHVRAVRRAKQLGMPGLRPNQPRSSLPTSLLTSAPGRFISHAVTAVGLDHPIDNTMNIVDALRKDPAAFIKSLASPQNMPPTQDTRIPTPPVKDPTTGAMMPAPGSTPLQPATPAMLVESIPVLGPIFTNARVDMEKDDTAGALGDMAPLLPSAMRAARGMVRGVATGANSLARGGGVLESATAAGRSAMGGDAAIQGRAALPRMLQIGDTQVPLMLDEIDPHNPGLAEIFGRLGHTSSPVKDFNEARTSLLETAIEREAKFAPPGGVLRTLDGTVIDNGASASPSSIPGSAANRDFSGSTTIAPHDFEKMSPLTITELRTSLDKMSYDQLTSRFFSQMFEDAMKAGPPNSPPRLDAKALISRIDSIPKENMQAMLGTAGGPGQFGGPGSRGVPTSISASVALKNMRDLAETMGELQDNGSLVGKIERLHVAGYRRFGPMFLYLQDATGLIGINHLAGLVVTHPDLTIGLRNFLKAGPGTAAELNAGEAVIEKALERNYGKESEDSNSPSGAASDLKMPLLSDRAPGSNDAVLSDLVDAVTGDPRLFSSALDQVDSILYGSPQERARRGSDMAQLGLTPGDVRLGEMPLGPGEVGRTVATRTYRPGSLGEAFSRLRTAVGQHAMPPGGGDPKITADIIKSKLPEDMIAKTGIMDWLEMKIKSGAKIYKSELQQLTKNLTYKAKDIQPSEFEMVVQPAGTPRTTSMADSAQQIENQKSRAAVKNIAGKVEDEGPGFIENKVQSIEELAANPNRPAWQQLPGGGKQYIPALDHRTLIEDKNWKRMLFQAKKDIDMGYTGKTPAQIKKAEETLIRVLAKYRKWEQDTAATYSKLKVSPPINIKGASIEGVDAGATKPQGPMMLGQGTPTPTPAPEQAPSPAPASPPSPSPSPLDPNATSE